MNNIEIEKALKDLAIDIEDIVRYVSNVYGKELLETISDREIAEYIADEDRFKVYEEIGWKNVLNDAREEFSTEEMLDLINDKEDVAEWLDSTSEVSGYRVVKCDNLHETTQLESYLRRIGKMV